MLRAALQRTRSQFRRTWHKLLCARKGPELGEAEVLEALRSLPFEAPRTVLVHSSLSSCGLIHGGALTLIRALRAWNTSGTLAMPTHSYCYPDAQGKVPVFDPSLSPSRVGAITDVFWRQPGVKRSLHPTHSLACEGPGAEVLVSGHENCDTPCGRGTPYERLIEQDAAVLMFGITLNSFTLFHTAEDAVGAPYLYEPQPVNLKFRTVDGIVRGMNMRKQDMNVARSFAEKDRWLEKRGLLHRIALGCGELLFLPHSRNVHEAVVTELRQDPYFLTAIGSATLA